MKTSFSRSRRQHSDHGSSQQNPTPFFNTNHQTVQPKEEPFFQPKLTIGQPNDVYEQEADAMAEQVVNTPAIQTAAPAVQKKSGEEEKKPDVQTQGLPGKEKEKEIQTKAIPEEEEKLQMKTTPEEEEKKIRKKEMPEEEKEKKVRMKSNGGGNAGNGISLSAGLNSTRGSGQAMSSGTRTGIESGFQTDFSNVKIHTDDTAVQMNQELHAQAFTHGNDIYFNKGKYDPDTSSGKLLLAHELTHTLQPNNDTVKKKDKSGATPAPGTGTTGSAPVGIQGGESTTPSDQKKMAEGYSPNGDGKYKAPGGRIISEDQATAESNVINSEGIFMIAYLGRYDALSKYPDANKDELSARAGFMKQFKTGDIVLRMMKAEDSQGIATVTNSSYSHSGIIQVNGGRVWVLDSYPGRKTAGMEDSTILTRFEDFFSNQHGEQIIQGLVLKIKGMSDAIRALVNEIIQRYDTQKTTFDFDFRIDDDQNVLYCSELVWRILKEANTPEIPKNEYNETLNRVESQLVPSLTALIAYKQSQHMDTSKDQASLNMLSGYIATFKSQPSQEMYSPGSLEHDPGFESLTGFRSNGIIEGRYDIIATSAIVPDDTFDTPDSYVTYGSMFKTKTSVKDDTTKPVWNEKLSNESYTSLQNVVLQLYDEDIISDDLLATFSGDLRPVRPAGEMFTLTDSGATLSVQVKSDDPNNQVQAPREVK